MKKLINVIDKGSDMMCREKHLCYMLMPEEFIIEEKSMFGDLELKLTEDGENYIKSNIL